MEGFNYDRERGAKTESTETRNVVETGDWRPERDEGAGAGSGGITHPHAPYMSILNTMNNSVRYDKTFNVQHCFGVIKCKCLLFEMHHGMWLDTQETEEALSLTGNVAERSKERFNAEICED